VSDRRARLISGSPEAVQEILGVLDAATIRILLPARIPWRRQVLAIALVDLLARLFPRIEIVGAAEREADLLLPPGQRLLGERLEEARTHGTTPKAPGTSPAVTIALGDPGGLGDGDAQVIHCDGDGWQAYLGPEPSTLAGEGDRQIPIGPLTAACRAAARAFAIATGGRGPGAQELSPTYWSALTFEASSVPIPGIDLLAPKHISAVLAGAGSIGGASAYAFARVPELGGELHVVDPQTYAANNPDRALLATNAVAAREVEKAAHVAHALGHLRDLGVQPYRGSIEQWVASRPLGPLPLVLCGFDSVASRRELQDALPLEVVNAACGGDHIAISGHVTDEGPCVYCLHIADVLDAERITFKLIVASTGLPPRLVQAWLEQRVPLGEQQLREIERNRGMATGTLSPYVGVTVDELHRLALAYGEFNIEIGDGVAAVAAPWVTALAGFIMAGEALKAGGGDAYQRYRLGPWSPGRTRYEELLYGSAGDGIVHPVARWAGSECLCRSARRLRLLGEIYADA
jgi:hypothetical protein